MAEIAWKNQNTPSFFSKCSNYPYITPGVPLYVPLCPLKEKFGQIWSHSWNCMKKLCRIPRARPFLSKYSKYPPLTPTTTPGGTPKSTPEPPKSEIRSNLTPRLKSQEKTVQNTRSSSIYLKYSKYPRITPTITPGGTPKCTPEPPKSDIRSNLTPRLKSHEKTVRNTPGSSIYLKIYKISLGTPICMSP